jgi:hypothetical protein
MLGSISFIWSDLGRLRILSSLTKGQIHFFSQPNTPGWITIGNLYIIPLLGWIEDNG